MIDIVIGILIVIGFSLILVLPEILNDLKKDRNVKKILKLKNSPNLRVVLKVRGHVLYFEVPDLKITGKILEAPKKFSQELPELDPIKIHYQGDLEKYKSKIKITNDLVKFQEKELRILDEQMKRYLGNFN